MSYFLITLAKFKELHSIHYGHGTPEEEVRLLYVAMTRAMEQLILTDRPSEFTTRLETALGKVAVI